MFGLEKSPREKFDFDLEIDLKDNPQKTKELLNKIDSTTKKIKQKLKSGGSKEDLNKLGVMLEGYTALLKVLKKIQKS